MPNNHEDILKIRFLRMKKYKFYLKGPLIPMYRGDDGGCRARRWSSDVLAVSFVRYAKKMNPLWDVAGKLITV